MIRKIILAVLVAVIVTLACILLGTILSAITIQVAITVGNFLKTYSSVIGVIAGLWYYLTGTV